MSEEKRDYVAETVKTFITGSDMEPTDPVKAIEAYFEKNASADLKARAKAEGKTAKTCWTFLEAVASKALGGRSGHIDPVVVYAIAMHYFDDIPVDWEEKAKKESKSKSEVEQRKKKSSVGLRASTSTNPALPIEIGEPEPEEPKAEEETKMKAKAKVKKHFKKQQGFFFDMIETPIVGPSGSEATAEGKEAGDVNAQ